MRESTLVTVRVKPEVAIRLEKLTTSMECSKSWLAAEAIEEYLDIHEWQIQAINEGIGPRIEAKRLILMKLKNIEKTG